jgi:hypothetical protein
MMRMLCFRNEFKIACVYPFVRSGKPGSAANNTGWRGAVFSTVAAFWRR